MTGQRCTLAGCARQDGAKQSPYIMDGSRSITRSPCVCVCVHSHSHVAESAFCFRRVQFENETSFLSLTRRARRALFARLCLDSSVVGFPSSLTSYSMCARVCVCDWSATKRADIREDGRTAKNTRENSRFFFHGAFFVCLCLIWEQSGSVEWIK